MTWILYICIFYSHLDRRRAKKMKRGPTTKLEGRFIITEVAPDGEPIAPKAAAKKYIRQSGCLVRDHIPISFRLWKANNISEQREAVPKRENNGSGGS